MAGLAASRGTCLSLRDQLRSEVPCASREQATTWLAEPAVLSIDHGDLLVALAGWRESAGHGVWEDSHPAVHLLVQAAARGESVTYNAVRRERQGGRRECFYVPHYRGPLLLAGELPAPLSDQRVHLQSIPSVLRCAIRPPPGHCFIDADIARCFPAIGAALSRDQRLHSHLQGDIHQLVGRHLAPSVAAEAQRKLGKAVNNGLICGMTGFGLQNELRERGVAVSMGQAERFHAEWWALFPDFRDFMGGIDTLIERRVASRLGLNIEAPDGRVFRFSPAELAGFRGESIGERAHRKRRLVSALFRAVEGCILDRALELMYRGRELFGLRLALPMYDGLLAVVPESEAERGRRSVRRCLERALADVGVAATVKVEVRDTWGTTPSSQSGEEAST